MGCDIHMFAEIKKNGQWEATGKIFKNPYYKPEMESEIDEDGYEWNAEFTVEPYTGRNYDLFAILADVRNGRGFAGVKTGEGFNPISSPKGLPKDISSKIAEESERWDGDGHSHSYFTVEELINYDWNQTTMKQGYLTLNEFKEVIETCEKPTSWCGGVSGADIVHVDESTAKTLITSGLEGTQYEGKDVYVLYHWGITYRDHCINFLEKTIPTLQTLGEPQDVRIVFWFDN